MNIDKIKIMGKARSIKPFKQKFRDVKVYGFDTETVNGRIYSLQVYGKDVNIYQNVYKWSEKQILDFLYKRFAGCYLYAHNLSFDLGVCFGDMILDNEKKFHYFNYFCNVIYPNPCFGMFSKNKRGVMTFSDTMPFFNMSLMKAAKFIGYKKKLKRPSYLGERMPKKDELEYFKKYAMMDAEICFKIAEKIRDFHKEFDIPLRYTVSVASLSAKIFKKYFITRNIPMPPKKVIDMALRSYHGGRTEAFSFGHSKNVKFYDINSSYPYSMQNVIIPLENKWIRTKVLYEFGFYSIDCEIPKMKISPMPYDKNGLLQFPCGKFKNAILTGMEAIEVSKIATKFRVNYGYFYAGKSKKLMKDFIQYFFDKKKKSKNKVDYHFNKIIMNGAYGKFIQMNTDSQNYGGYNCGEGFIRSSKNVRPAGLFNPPIASWITAISRLNLYNEMKKHERHVLYCDTDSIALTRSGKMRSSKELGKFQIEKTGSDFYAIREKFYILKSKVILKTGRHAFRGNDSLLLACIEGKEYIENDEFNKVKFKTIIKKGKLIYLVNRMVKLNESKVRKVKPFVMEKREFDLNLKPSKKRCFINSRIEKSDLDLISSFYWLKPFFVFE